MLETYQVILGIALLFIVIEVLVGSFLFLGFSVGISLVAFVHYLTTEVSVARDLIVFCVTSSTSFYLFRRYFKSAKDSRSAENDINNY